MVRAAAVLVALALTLSIGAADSGTQVTLDLVAADARGRSIEGLTPADLDVSEGGVAVPVSSVQLVRASGTPGQELPPRVVGIFLDEFHVSPGASADSVRDSLLAFVSEALGPSDLSAVVKPLDSLVDITLTADRAKAIEAIRGFTPRRGDYTPRTQFEREFIAGSEARVRAARAHSSAAAVTARTGAAGRAPAPRKTVFVVTEGISRTAGRRGDNVLPGLDSAAAAANRAHVAIYPIDMTAGPMPSSGHGGPSAAQQEEALAQAALVRLAASTSGQIIAHAQVAGGLRQALGDGSSYFVVTLNPPVAPGDGRLHDVAVTAKSPAVRLRARAAYWLPMPAPVPKPPDFGDAAGLRRRTSPLIQTWFGMVQRSRESTQVSFAWEPSPAAETTTVRGRTAPSPPVRIKMSVTALDGTRLFEGDVDPSTRVTFDAHPGRALVQLSIEDVAARIIDQEVRELAIAAYTDRGAIGAPEILRARTARDLRELRDNPEAPPTTGRRFSRAETLLVRIPIVGRPDAPPAAQLVSALGSTLRDLRPAPLSTREGVYEIALPLAALASGEYAIEIRASVGGHRLEDRFPFRVTP
jgi:VWFA-related protein